MSIFNKYSKETRNLLIGFEKEFRDRLISIENGIHTIAEKIDPALSDQIPNNIYRGHPDQAFGPYTYAQHGEDLIFANIFWLLNIENPSYIDIGAHHPINISNTALLYKRGSRGINIEANPNLIGAFYEHRPRDINLNIGISDKPGNLEFYCIDEYSGRNTFDRKTAEKFVLENPEFKIREVKTVEVKTINDIIRQYANGVYPDLLSIDIEGLDYRVLSSADFSKSFPKVICAEITQLNMGENICELLESRDYIPYTCTVGNIIFIHKSVYRPLFSKK